jgi:hypothetical protein
MVIETTIDSKTGEGIREVQWKITATPKVQLCQRWGKAKSKKLIVIREGKGLEGGRDGKGCTNNPSDPKRDE